MKIRKNDMILIGVVLLLAIGILVYQNRSNATVATKVEVSVDGELFGVYSLIEEQQIQIGEHNLLLIQDGYADMIEADCPDLLCVKQRRISKAGESIVCLPNKVIVTVTGVAESGQLDAIVQ